MPPSRAVRTASNCAPRSFAWSPADAEAMLAGIDMVHASCRDAHAHGESKGVEPGFFSARQGTTSPRLVAALKQTLASIDCAAD
jgi:hypothetical protein